MLPLRKRSDAAASDASAFAAGSRVEVHHDGAWYEATVTEVLPSHRYLDVVYATLVSNDDPSQPLRETVFSSRVRPRPPRFSALAGWALHQLVEVCCRDGWRVGVVADVGGGCGTYSVCFPDTREVLNFAASDIRPRLVWCDHQWFVSDDGDQEGAEFGVGMQVEVTENHGLAWFPGTVAKVIDKTTFFVEYKKPQEDGRTKLSGEILDAQYVRPVRQPTPQNKVFYLLEEIEVWHCGGWMAGVVSNIVDDSTYVVKLKHGKEEEIEFNQSDMRTRCNWKNGRWTCSRKRRGRPSHLPTAVSSSSPCDIEQTSKINLKCKMADERSSEGQMEASQPTKKLRKEDPITPVKEIELYTASQDFEKPSNELVAGTFSGEAVLEEYLSLDELSEDPSLHKCSNTSVLVVRGEESLNSNRNRSEHSERDVLAASQGFENPQNELVPGIFCGEHGLEKNLSLDELSEDSCLHKCSNTSKLIVRGPESSNSMRGGSDHSRIINHLFSCHQNRHDSVLATDCRNIPKQNEMFPIPRSCQEDPKIIDARHHPNAEMKKIKDTPLKESTESINRMNVASPFECSSVKTLPFKKISKLWETVYSMEVFHKMPQDPSFRKLEQCPMNLREGEAIGLMVSFVSLADSVSKLCISDSQSAFKEKLEDLKRFEENGFDVLHIRERIEELLEI